MPCYWCSFHATCMCVYFLVFPTFWSLIHPPEVHLGLLEPCLVNDQMVGVYVIYTWLMSANCCSFVVSNDFLHQYHRFVCGLVLANHRHGVSLSSLACLCVAVGVCCDAFWETQHWICISLRFFLLFMVCSWAFQRA